jgi:membrane protein implicated in regulation of membrane protease activity
MTIGLLYIGLFLIGLVYAVITGVVGWWADFGHADVQVDASGHLDAGHAHPISGTTIGTFVAGFGGGGILGHYVLAWPLIGSLGTALGLGLLMAVAAFFVLELIFSQTEAGSEFSTESLVGRPAEVISPIPEDGTGEVAYIVKGQREQSPARSSEGTALSRGQRVIIVSARGTTVIVRSDS